MIGRRSSWHAGKRRSRILQVWNQLNIGSNYLSFPEIGEVACGFLIVGWGDNLRALQAFVRMPHAKSGSGGESLRVRGHSNIICFMCRSYVYVIGAALRVPDLLVCHLWSEKVGSRALSPSYLQLFTSSVTVFPSFSTTVCRIVLQLLSSSAPTTSAFPLTPLSGLVKVWVWLVSYARWEV